MMKDWRVLIWKMKRIWDLEPSKLATRISHSPLLKLKPVNHNCLLVHTVNMPAHHLETGVKSEKSDLSICEFMVSYLGC